MRALATERTTCEVCCADPTYVCRPVGTSLILALVWVLLSTVLWSGSPVAVDRSESRNALIPGKTPLRLPLLLPSPCPRHHSLLTCQGPTPPNGLTQNHLALNNQLPPIPYNLVSNPENTPMPSTHPKPFVSKTLQITHFIARLYLYPAIPVQP